MRVGIRKRSSREAYADVDGAVWGYSGSFPSRKFFYNAVDRGIGWRGQARCGVERLVVVYCGQSRYCGG